MVRKYGHGWFRESTRHSLAARGIKTRYFARSRKQIVRELMRAGRVEEAEKLQKEVEMHPGVAQPLPDPESSRSKFVKRLLSKEGAEGVMEELRFMKLSPEEKLELHKKMGELKKLQEFLQDDDKKEMRASLKADIKSLRGEIEDEPDPVRVAELEVELQDALDDLAPIDATGAAKRRDELLDEVNELRGLGRRAEAIPGGLTEEQLLKRLGQKRVAAIPDVDELSSETLVKVFRSVFKEDFPAAKLEVDGTTVVVKASRPEVIEKLPEGMRLTVDKEVTEDEMRDFLRKALLRKEVVSEKPLKRGFTDRKGIVVEGRTGEKGLLVQLSKLHERGKKIDPKPAEMATALDLSRISPARLKGKIVKVPKDVVLPRQSVSDILEKRETKKAEAAEMRAKSTELVAGEAAQTKAPGKVLMEEAKELKKARKQSKKEWEEVLGADFDEGDFK